MKLSVSIPDPLWEQATELRPGLNPSHLIQAALERMVTASSSAALSTERPKGAEDAFAKARSRLAAEARGQFEDGYGAGLEAAETLPLWCIESLATRHNFDVKGWAGGFAMAAMQADMGQIHPDDAPSPEVIGALGKGLGDFVPPFFDDAFTPTVAYVRGFAQAMRDLWTDVYEGGVLSSTASGEAPMAD